MEVLNKSRYAKNEIYDCQKNKENNESLKKKLYNISTFWQR